MKSSKYSFLFSYVDMLYAILLAIFSLFMLSFLLITVHKNETGKVDTDAQLQIVMSWGPDGVANDIDLWVKPPPPDAPVGYSHMQNSYMYLARDDLGKSNDFAVINGQHVVIPGHTEVTSIRGMTPGHYVANAEFFADHATDDSGDMLPGDVSVTIKLIQLNPYAVLGSSTFVLHKQNDQYTGLSFDITPQGGVINVDTKTQDPFITGPAAGAASGGPPE